jgi:hypothetical protein
MTKFKVLREFYLSNVKVLVKANLSEVDALKMVNRQKESIKSKLIYHKQ